MNVLQRWLPFRFRRKSHNDKQAEVVPAEPSTSAPRRRESPWPAMSPPLSMDQWMRDFFEHPFGGDPGNIERWFGDFTPARFSPRLDVSEEEGALKVSVELPGMSKDDVELTVENGTLTIHGEKRHEEESDEEGVYRTERYYGYVHRSLPLPEDVDQENVEAQLDKGVLTVRLPKLARKEESSTRISIKG